MSAIVPPDQLPLQRLYHWERTAPDRVAFTQPVGGGQVVDYTWKQVVDQARRMAAWLQSQGIGTGRQGRDAVEEHRALDDDGLRHLDGRRRLGAAVPDAGRRHDPPDPRAQRGQAAVRRQARRLAGHETRHPGRPALRAHPLADADAKKSYPGWDDIVARTAPLAGEPVRPADDMSTIMYTSGTTGAPKGVMHTFGNFMAAVQRAWSAIPQNENSRMLSYLPLSHVVERALVEHAQLRTGMHVYFAESLDTFTADMQRARPTVFFSVPRLWVKFQQAVNHKMPPKKLDLFLKIPVLSGIVKKKILTTLGLNECVFAAGGAAPMPAELLAWYSQAGPERRRGLRHDREHRGQPHHHR
jgi:long-chain acyl-CoA synthetase